MDTLLKLINTAAIVYMTPGACSYVTMLRASGHELTSCRHLCAYYDMRPSSYWMLSSGRGQSWPGLLQDKSACLAV